MVDYGVMAEGLFYIFNLKSFLMLTAGVMTGIIIGSIPGLTTTMGMAIFVPLTFFMPPLIGIPFLIGIYKGGIFGGSIPAILISTPGTGAAAATVADGYALTQKGKARSAIQMSIFASCLADFSSDILVLFFAYQVTKLALVFGAPEIFSIIVFSLLVISTSSAENLPKGLISLALGLVFSMVGVDTGGRWRFTFDVPDLAAGLSYISVLIGLFAFSVVIDETLKSIKEKIVVQAKLDPNDHITWRDIKQCMPAIVRSTLLGTFIGIVPGIGQPVAAFLGFAQAKRFSKTPELVGKGSLEGVAGAEAGNNAVNGPSLLPLFAFGIPGDVISSVLLGAFLAQGLRPGPRLFIDHGKLMYAILIGMIFANIILFALANMSSKYIAKIITIPKHFIIPTVFVLTIVGSFAVNNSWFDVGVMFVFGIIGYMMNKFDVPMAPLVIAFILTHTMETNLIRSIIIFKGSLAGFLGRPVALGFIAVSLIIFFYSLMKPLLRRYKARKMGRA